MKPLRQSPSQTRSCSSRASAVADPARPVSIIAALAALAVLLSASAAPPAPPPRQMPAEPMCCQIQPVVNQFSLQGDQLVEG